MLTINEVALSENRLIATAFRRFGLLSIVY